jgi:transcriptional regulator with XRE-family HTH domain
VQSASPSAPSRVDATLPRRSRLFALEPRALQTSAVESFTSYLMRLAEAHSVPLGTLIHVAVAPRLQNAFMAQGPSRNVTIFLRAAALLNSHGVSASDWVQALTALTLRTDLPLLTMLPWAQVVSSRQLVHPQRQWCPCCFQEWRVKGHLVYEPLVWTIAGVQVCPTHRCPLEQQCPSCQQGLAFLAWHARPGSCFHCGAWLGRSVSRHVSKREASAIQQTELVGALLALTPRSGPVSQTHFLAALRTLVGQVTEGNLAAFARLVGLTKTTLWELANGRFPPPLSVLLRLCLQFQLPLVDLLLIQAEGSTVTPASSPPGKSTTPHARHVFPLEQVRQALQEVLADTTKEPLSMRAVAAQLGYPQRTINTHLPDLCKAITRRYQAPRKERGVQRIADLRSRVRTAALQVHAKGINPTYQRVGAVLGSPGSFREQPARAALHEVRQELGWE